MSCTDLSISAWIGAIANKGLDEGNRVGIGSAGGDEGVDEAIEGVLGDEGDDSMGGTDTFEFDDEFGGDVYIEASVVFGWNVLPFRRKFK